MIIPEWIQREYLRHAPRPPLVRVGSVTGSGTTSGVSINLQVPDDQDLLILNLLTEVSVGGAETITDERILLAFPGQTGVRISSNLNVGGQQSARQFPNIPFFVPRGSLLTFTVTKSAAVQSMSLWLYFYYLGMPPMQL